MTTGRREYQVVEGLDVNEFSRGRIDRSTAELVEERDSVASLGCFLERLDVPRGGGQALKPRSSEWWPPPRLRWELGDERLYGAQ